MVVFACPYHLAVFAAFIESEFKVVRLRNRFSDPPEDGSIVPDVLLNFEYFHHGLTQIVELQLSLEMFFALKRFQYKPQCVLQHSDAESFVRSKEVFKAVANIADGAGTDAQKVDAGGDARSRVATNMSTNSQTVPRGAAEKESTGAPISPDVARRDSGQSFV